MIGIVVSFVVIDPIACPQALIKIHAIVNRQPGANMVSEQSFKAFLVINAAYFLGLFTFAVFLGIVSDEVKRSFRSVTQARMIAGFTLFPYFISVNTLMYTSTCPLTCAE